jgi:hypothetical protein
MNKPIHELSDEEIDRILEGLAEAMPLKPPTPSKAEIYKKAMLLGVDPCDLLEARHLIECMEANKEGVEAHA